MSVVEFSCDLCVNRFHELQGAKCFKCNKLICPDCQKKSDGEVICVPCKRLENLENKKFEINNLIKSLTNRSTIDYSDMKHNDRLKYDKDYLSYSKHNDRFEQLQTLRRYLKITVFIFILIILATIVLQFLHGYNLTIFLSTIGILALICATLAAIIQDIIKSYYFDD